MCTFAEPNKKVMRWTCLPHHLWSFWKIRLGVVINAPEGEFGPWCFSKIIKSIVNRRTGQSADSRHSRRRFRKFVEKLIHLWALDSRQQTDRQTDRQTETDRQQTDRMSREWGVCFQRRSVGIAHKKAVSTSTMLGVVEQQYLCNQVHDF